jgi:hypothetical protein
MVPSTLLIRLPLGCDRLARLVMQHFAGLESNEDSDAEDMDQWDDVLCDGDENTPPLGSKARLVPSLSKAPLGTALLNRIPTLDEMYVLQFHCALAYLSVLQDWTQRLCLEIPRPCQWHFTQLPSYPFVCHYLFVFSSI